MAEVSATTADGRGRPAWSMNRCISSTRPTWPHTPGIRRSMPMSDCLVGAARSVSWPGASGAGRVRLAPTSQIDLDSRLQSQEGLVHQPQVASWR